MLFLNTGRIQEFLLLSFSWIDFLKACHSRQSPPMTSIENSLSITLSRLYVNRFCNKPWKCFSKSRPNFILWNTFKLKPKQNSPLSNTTQGHFQSIQWIASIKTHIFLPEGSVANWNYLVQANYNPYSWMKWKTQSWSKLFHQNTIAIKCDDKISFFYFSNLLKPFHFFVYLSDGWTNRYEYAKWFDGSLWGVSVNIYLWFY